MFWERFSNLCSENGISANAVCSKLGLSTATATHWKNGTMPKGDVLSKIADFFSVSVDYLLGRVSYSDETGPLNTKNDVAEIHSDFENLSEAQRAMLKCRINQLMIIKFKKESYFDDLNNELQVGDSFCWFMNLNDYSLDNKISQMLTMLNVSGLSLFDGMSIVIKTKSAAQALQLDFSEDAIFPILVSGRSIFNSLSSLSISSLSVLDKEVLGQFEIRQKHSSGNISDDIHNELKSSFKSNLQV